MFDFLSQLVHVVLPRLRDFHGVSPKAFDGRGNYSIGLKEQSIFPELSFEDTNVLHGLQINIVTTTDDNDQARALLAKLGMPFEKENK
jgi:large subunit ribosomal protein L5